jgi:hypothetical protein
MQPSRKMHSRAMTVACAASALALATGASVAHADLFGGDVAVLTSIFQTTLKQLDQLRSMTDTLGKSYRETQRVARLAQETKDAYRDFQRRDSDRSVSSGVRAVYGALPDTGYAASDLRSGFLTQARGSGQLVPEVEACVESLMRARSGPSGATLECDQLRRAASAERMRSSLERTYGAVPAGRGDLAALRAEHVATEQSRMASQAKAALVSRDASTMLKLCNDASDPVVCGRVGAEASVKGYEQQAETNRKLDELVRQQAVANETRIAEERRAVSEERARRAALQTGVTTSASDPGAR